MQNNEIFTNVKMTQQDLNDPNAKAFWEKYQKGAIFTCLPSSMNEDYIGLGVIGESGELAEKFKKYIRGDYKESEDLLLSQGEYKNLLIKEIGDVLWYCALAFHLREKPMPEALYLESSDTKMFRLFNAKDFVKYMRVVLGFVESDFEELSYQYIATYLHVICAKIEMTLKEAAFINNQKLLDRFSRDTINGGGDER